MNTHPETGLNAAQLLERERQDHEQVVRLDEFEQRLGRTICRAPTDYERRLWAEELRQRQLRGGRIEPWMMMDPSAVRR